MSSFCFLVNWSTIYGMCGLSFREYLQMQEKVLPPFAVPTTRINPLPVTQGRLKRGAIKPVRGSELFPPTIQKVAEVVPEKFVRKGRAM